MRETIHGDKYWTKRQVEDGKEIMGKKVIVLSKRGQKIWVFLIGKLKERERK